MTFEIDKQQQRLEGRIAKFSGKFMSNSKWFKLFNTLSVDSSLVNRCLIKNIGDERLRELEMSTYKHFTDTFHNKGIKDVTLGGPILFKEIELIEFPAKWQSKTQDLLAIKKLIIQTGKYEDYLDNDKLIIYGYR